MPKKKPVIKPKEEFNKEPLTEKDVHERIRTFQPESNMQRSEHFRFAKTN